MLQWGLFAFPGTVNPSGAVSLSGWRGRGKGSVDRTLGLNLEFLLLVCLLFFTGQPAVGSWLGPGEGVGAKLGCPLGAQPGPDLALIPPAH